MPPLSSPSPHNSHPDSSLNASSSPSSITGAVAPKRKKYAARKDNKMAQAEPDTQFNKGNAPDLLFESFPSTLLREPALVNTTSPVLDALTSLPLSQLHDTNIRTDDWTKSIPFGGTPPQEATSIGESPPTFIMPTDRGAFDRSATPASPPRSRHRPLSIGTEHSESPRYQSHDRQKRNSISTQQQCYPPPPHLPQAHFYSAPDIDIPGIPPIGTRAQETLGSSFCAVDNIIFQKPRHSVKKVLLVGRDGALEVLSLDGEQARLLGALRGLNGRVLDAKILTWTCGADPFLLHRPLVVATIFGPVTPDDTERPASVVPDNISTRQDGNPGRSDLPHMQTRVQVFSLRSQSLLATLFATKPETCYSAFPGSSPSVPPPSGDLRLFTSGNYIVVASGTSGEVLIFGASKNQRSPYSCLGKTWTNVRVRDTHRHSGSSNSTTTDELYSEFGYDIGFSETPILSLSGRWLAVSPPPSSRTSLGGTIRCHIHHKRIYETDAHNPPTRPTVTCVADYDNGSFLTNLTRGVTQEIFRGATWTGGQVAQTWNNYFYKDAHHSQDMASRRGAHMDPPHPNFFPPTHSQDTEKPSVKSPDLVSLIDLKRLEEGENGKVTTINPVATFQPPNGCGFVSLSPNGLMLLTVSRKGDIQHVWDLMQMRFCRSKLVVTDDISQTTPSLPAYVREVARFDRLTMTSILDVKWTEPIGERLGIATKNGTIHLYDIPKSAYQWPPLRRVQRHQKPNSDDSTKEKLDDPSPRGYGISTAVKVIGDTTQPILSAFRGRAPSVGAAFATVGIGFATSRGSKVIVSGLSKSVGAAAETMNAIRHFGENRMHLRAFAREAAPCRMAWLGDDCEPLLGIVDGEFFRVYKIRDGKKKQEQSAFGTKVREVLLPSYLRIPPGPSQTLLTMINVETAGHWSPPPIVPLTFPPTVKCSPLSQAEIETNAPYQPFHTDRRVNLEIFTAKYQDQGPDADPWVFGKSTPSRKLLLQANKNTTDPSNLCENGMENHINLGRRNGTVEYAVLTTRQKKRTGSGDAYGTSEGNEEGFFEDDCDILDFAADRV
ncbi:hypothetical protein LOZ51_001775 [Ophidiomyces ophidiicola]|nr:hypothetical protein LOZ55_004227 [Ophidiomyces ophidiicola]KAI1991297.1 hypothetical protein LOZ54_002174 [Ophidiomyces ophidiicola]KAI1999288.1 hypothetical protein LOZ51_001775 [Ophidiomyces ophidiicola]